MTKNIILLTLTAASIILLMPYFTYNDNEMTCIETHLSLNKNEAHILCGDEVKND
jgi:hypothetical protein